MCSTNMISVLFFIYCISSIPVATLQSQVVSSCFSHKITACFQKTWNLTFILHGAFLWYSKNTKNKTKKSLVWTRLCGGLKDVMQQMMQHPHGSILKADFDQMNKLIEHSAESRRNDGWQAFWRERHRESSPNFRVLQGVGLYFFEPVHLFIKKEGRRITVWQDEFTWFAIMRSDMLKAKVTGDVSFWTEAAKLPCFSTLLQLAYKSSWNKTHGEEALKNHTGS